MSPTQWCTNIFSFSLRQLNWTAVAFSAFLHLTKLSYNIYLLLLYTWMLFFFFLHHLCILLRFQSSCRRDAAPHRAPPLWRGGEGRESCHILLPGGRQPEAHHRVDAQRPVPGDHKGRWPVAAYTFVRRQPLLPECGRRQARTDAWGRLRLCGQEQCRQGHQP